MKTVHLILLASLLSLASGAHAQEARRELRSLGKAARLHWPALASLVDDAERAARADTSSEALVRQRYGRRAPTRAQADLDRRTLAEALEALWVLERAARAEGRPALFYRGVHGQLLTLINRGLDDARRQADLPASRSPLLSPAWDSGHSPRASVAALPRTQVTRVGLVRPVVMLLVALADDARTSAAGSGPLDATSFPRTLALAGEGTLYTLKGRAKAGTYTGWALLKQTAGRLELTVAREGRAPVRATLARKQDRWRAQATITRRAGLKGLGGEASTTLQLQAEYRAAGPGRIDGRWRTLTDADGAVVEQGRERLTRVDVAGAPADDVEPLLSQSALFAEIAAACRRVADRGTVPLDLLVTSANRVSTQVLLEGPAIFDEQARLIASATEEVLFQALTIEVESEAGRKILGALRRLGERPRQGPPVRVRLVINAHWAVDFGAQALVEAVKQLRLDPARVDAQVIPHTHKLLGGLHSKTLVVDGQRALVTGANPEFVHDAGTPWFDAAFRVDGKAALGLRQDFNHLWHKVTGNYLPPLETSAPAAKGRTPVLIATRKANGNPFSNSVDDPQGQAFVTAITRATRLVRIHTPNLNDDAIRNAIVEAASKNKVEVQLILPRGFNKGGSRLTGGTNVSNVKRLYRVLERRGGVGRLKIKWYAAADGSGATEGNVAGASHTKYASFDGQVAIVGSGNLDTQAMNHSREVNLVVDGADLVRAWDRQHFEPSWKRGVSARASEPTSTR